MSEHHDYFLDAEFDSHYGGHENCCPKLLSLGVASDDGRMGHWALDFDPEFCSPWIKENVLKHLPEERLSKEEVKDRLDVFVKGQAQFWGWYVAYDWFFFCQVMGGMLNLPMRISQHANELVQAWEAAKLPWGHLPLQDPRLRHCALQDALWHKAIWEKLKEAR